MLPSQEKRYLTQSLQMIGGFIHPRKPMANMYFVLFSYSMVSAPVYYMSSDLLFTDSVTQAQLLMRDLKIAQCERFFLQKFSYLTPPLIDTKLPPRAAFTAQIFGTLFGAVLNFSMLCCTLVRCGLLTTTYSVLMNSIIDNQREILLSVEGTNIWSGQQPQQYNSQAVAWGGLRYVYELSRSLGPTQWCNPSHELFAVGKRYQFVAWAYVIGLFVPVPFWIAYRYWPKLRTDYLYTPVIWCAWLLYIYG
jgi:hypothetical protein